jgi:phosphatidylglycerophosphate synthase
LDDKPEVVLVGDNPVRLWGLTMAERVRRIARARGFPLAEEGASGAALLVNLAFVFDPAWLTRLSGRPGDVLTSGNEVVIAHCRTTEEQAQIGDAIAKGREPVPGGMTQLAFEHAGDMINEELRKREQPFLLPLRQDTVRAAERASYFGAYKGVTDILTKYLWPEWALVLTRIAARLGISPNMVTAVAALFCVAATVLFWRGDYWLGLATGLAFMVLDTVDGKLARCTITSSDWGNIFDHGIDLVHPPFWWYAWAVGLEIYGRPLGSEAFWFAMIAIIGGYVVQRLIEGAFIALYGMHIHVWRKFDSTFRLITARRNPNMVILLASLLAARPDLGLLAVAWWTIISCLIHLLRLIQAMLAKAGGAEVRSWLS